MRSGSVLPIFVLITFAAVARAGEPVSTTGSTEAVQVIGFGDIKKKTKGTLELKDGVLHFTSGKQSFHVRGDLIHEVVTGNDTQRAIGGTVGTISEFAPYGGGRVLSLFRDKIDTLTIEYRDSNGALHGAIFTMPVGNAEPLKKDLLAQGAQTTIPVREELNLQSEAQERQQ